MNSIARALVSSLASLTGALQTCVRVCLDPRPFPRRLARDAPQRLVIVAPGPSARSILPQLHPPSETTAYATINDFFRDSHFGSLRPRYHVIADPLYWYDDCLDAHAGPLVEALAGVDWRCTLFLPTRASGSKLHSLLVEHGIAHVFFPSAPLEGPRAFRERVFSLGLAAPRVQNVLVAAVAIALWLGARETYLVGADHSWHREIAVDENNVVVHAGAHSYATAGERKPFWKPEGTRRVMNGLPTSRDDRFTIGELFLAWSRVHRGYEMLAELAAARGVRVLNASEGSFIDAFERVSPAVITRPEERGAAT